jgi:hypothetical protein
MIEHNQAYAKLMEGTDNYGRPRQEFAHKLITLNDAGTFSRKPNCAFGYQLTRRIIPDLITTGMPTLATMKHSVVRNLNYTSGPGSALPVH